MVAGLASPESFAVWAFGAGLVDLSVFTVFRRGVSRVKGKGTPAGGLGFPFLFAVCFLVLSPV